MTLPFFCPPQDKCSRRGNAATVARRERHELACRLVVASSPRLRRMRGRWQSLRADGVWRDV